MDKVLLEQLASELDIKPKIDHENFVIDNVLTATNVSKKQRRYHGTALKDVRDLQNSMKYGVKVNVAGHVPLQNKKNFQYNGNIRNLRAYSDVANIGTWHLRKNNPSSLMILEDAEEDPTMLCLSMEILDFKGKVADDGWLDVHNVTKVSEEYGLVPYGGTTDGLFLFEDHEWKPDEYTHIPLIGRNRTMLKTLEEFKAESPELYKALYECACAAVKEAQGNDDVKKQLTAMTLERDDYKSKYDQLVADQAAQKLAESRVDAINAEIADFNKKAKEKNPEAKDVVIAETAVNLVAEHVTFDDDGKPVLTEALELLNPYFAGLQDKPKTKKTEDAVPHNYVPADEDTPKGTSLWDQLVSEHN